MNRRRTLAIIAAVVLTLVGAVIVLGYVESAEDRATQGADPVPVRVANSDIPAGTTAEEVAQRTGIREVPRSLVAEDAVETPEDFADLGDQVVTERILAGQQIVVRQFGDGPAGARRGRRGGGEGREVISMRLESQRALGGDIASGDLVGIIVSIEGRSSGDDAGGDECTAETGMVLSQVEVVEVTGGVVDPESGEGGGGDALMVSFDVDETEAEVLAFAAEYGSVWLTRQTEQSGNRDSDTQRCDVFDVLPGRRA